MKFLPSRQPTRDVSPRPSDYPDKAPSAAARRLRTAWKWRSPVERRPARNLWSWSRLSFSNLSLSNEAELLHQEGIVAARGERPVGGVSAFRRRCEAEPRGHCHQVGERVSLHLSHHPAAVCLHRDLADAELATDLFIHQTGDDQRHDLPFAAGEAGMTVPERPYLRLVTKCSVAAL